MNLSEKLGSLAEDYRTQIRRSDFIESKALTSHAKLQRVPGPEPVSD